MRTFLLWTVVASLALLVGTAPLALAGDPVAGCADGFELVQVASEQDPPPPPTPSSDFREDPPPPSTSEWHQEDENGDGWVCYKTMGPPCRPDFCRFPQDATTDNNVPFDAGG